MPSTAEAKLLEAVSAVLTNEPGPVSVGYSGGRDSGVLLWAAARLGPVTAVYVDHGWRPEAERQAERSLVEEWCARLEVPLAAFSAPPLIERSEAGARRHRYACFEEHLSRHGGILLLGHHADDQAETVLLRLLQGRSWQGLGGMPARRGPYRRPWLTLPGELISEAASLHHIPFHTDTTNADESFSRNLVRGALTQLKTRFPAVSALNHFAAVWHELVPQAVPGTWTSAEGHRVPAGVWDSWSPLRRQAELLALAGERLPRRFLEQVCRDGRRGPARASGWFWTRLEGTVTWSAVAPEPVKEYFVVAERGRVYDLPGYRMEWTDQGLFVPGMDPDLPWVWRSWGAGQELVSERGVWTKKHRRRLGTLPPERAALVYQRGRLRAVVDPLEKRLVWCESMGSKLQKKGIFVTLVTVMPFSTESV